MAHTQTNLYQFLASKLCGLIGWLYSEIEISGTRNLHRIERSSVQCEFLVPDS